jgi:TolB-like protein/Tfp pilus assembly protein PilF
MPSLHPDFAYDLFISYRHNDNLPSADGPGWVTLFVESLEKELKSTVKEPLSIYFDKNPHDGLLETHHVDKSLEGKLKCLIFIPIISHTYCDPKSFAWQHEFCAFNALARADALGRDVRLANGNVASRILPVRIHDIDARDKAFIEQEIGGVLRPIDYIYKSAGVNRPLTSSDKKEDNAYATHYRDQINKTANAVKELINTIKNPHAPKEQKVSPAPATEQPASKKKAWVALGILLLAVAGYFIFRQLPATTQPALDKSIAVLPFVNMSNDPEQEYFSDGLTEEIINVLVQIEGLKVIARTSSFQFKGKNEDLRLIGERLGVATVLEGSIRKSANQLRVTAQLIKTSDGTHLWSKTFDSDLDNIFRVQDEIARSVAQDFKLTLESLVNPGGERPRNAEAMKRYQMGRSLYDQGDGHQADARKYFEQATQLDSAFASAWSYLAISWISSDTAKFVQYNRKALSIDPNEPDALANKMYHLGNNAKFREADQVLQYALSLRLEVPRLLRQEGQCMFRLGRYDKAIDLCKRAVELDPLQAYSYSILGDAYMAKGQFDEAAKSHQRTYEINRVPLRYAKSLIHASQFAEAEKLIPEIWDGSVKTHLYAMLYFSNGQKAKADQYLEQCKRLGISLELAGLYAYRGERDLAFRVLEQVYAKDVTDLYLIKAEPLLIPLREDKRFVELVRKMGFPGE